MAHIYEKYPEVILFDATYKMNNHNLPLFIQLCIDGNGQTEIASLYICRSESRDGIGAMLDVFKEFNCNWHKTKVFVGDKDFADRAVYKEKFADASLHICLYHVLKTFNREITTVKRQITTEQRCQALKVLEKLVYATSSESYDLNYKELRDLDLEEVTSYYEDNWHNIREQWSMFGRNKYAHYMNTTNNRCERLNRTFKQIGSRYSNLLVFFQNITTSVAVIASEKDIKAVRSTMKTERKRFANAVLQQ